jgi:hypothetical protein
MSLNTLAKTEFYLSNRNRRFNEEPLEFTADLRNTSEVGPSTYYLRLDEVILENFFPTIQQDVNNTFYYVYNGVSDFFIIQEGNYDIYSLIDSVQAALTTLNAGFLLSYDTYQMKLSLFIPAGVTFSIIRNNERADFPVDFTYPDPTDRFLEVLGWGFNQGTEKKFIGGVAGVTFVPDNPVRCRASAYYDLCTDAPVSQTYSNGRNFSLKILQRIYTGSVPYGTIVNHRTLIDQPYGIDLTNVSQIKFFLVDEWQERVFASSGMNILMAIRFSITPAGV